MKTAAEWIEGWNLPAPKTIGDQDWKASIEFIQLDAWKQGMADAAKICKNRNRHNMAKAILDYEPLFHPRY